MNATLTRITAKIVAPVVGIGMLVGATAIFANTPASANPASTMSEQSCTTSTGVGAAKAGAPDMMTRAGQVAASAPTAPSAAVSCSGH